MQAGTPHLEGQGSEVCELQAGTALPYMVTTVMPS